MKTKKIVIGTMAAAMLSLSVCSLIPAAAAGETVQITAGNASAKAGEEFEVEVTLADIPDSGARGCSFSIEFDNSIITIDDIVAGELTNGAGENDESASLIPTFNITVENDEGFASVMWSTALDDSKYWLKGEGVLCTVKGTVASTAKDGDKSTLKIVPVKRNTNSESGIPNDTIDCGYLKDGVIVNYDIEAVAGSVTVGDGNDIAASLKGDANCDGVVTIADAAAILQMIGNPDKYSLSEKGTANADVVEPAGITAADAIEIQKLDAGLIDKL
ncbi:MAG: hypothetical protein IKV85_01050 [Ruminococcus sp.]|jgi:hypothetical protein|nr:hypothetical protein [Ruminococcus sp.]